MPANVWDPMVRSLAGEFPGLIGNLMGPGGWRKTHAPHYALDNGRYKGESWSADLFWDLIRRAETDPIPPRFLTVPDVYGDVEGTLREWDHWRPRLEPIGWPLAFVWQDGMTADRARDVGAPVQFIGCETREAKWAAAKEAYEGGFPRIHVGRVNRPECAMAGVRYKVESIDGTGWRRTDRQRRGMRHALELLRDGETETQPLLFDDGTI